VDKIIVMNRYLIQHEINVDHIVISMSDDEKFFPPIPEKNCLGILKIEVFDWDGEILKSLYCDGKPVPQNKIYNSEHAKKVLEFVFTFLDKVKIIVAQCDAGISRSSATAAALSKIIRNDDDSFFKIYYPNKLIYSTILKEYISNKESYRTKYNLNFPDYF
jgi:hypothetical protein